MEKNDLDQEVESRQDWSNQGWQTTVKLFERFPRLQ